MFNDKLIAGTHDFKAGVQISRERMAYDRDRNGDILLELRDGVPFQAQLANTPVRSDHRLNTWAVFLQDQWRVRRFTVNAGLRLDGVRERAGAVESGRNVCGRAQLRRDLWRRRISRSTSRRGSASPTICSARGGRR